MATITGLITRDNGVLNLNHNDFLQGTDSADTISGLAGDDVIYAGFGNDTVHAGLGNDTVSARNFGDVMLHAAYGNDVVYGDAGNDILNYGNTTSSVTLYGDGSAYSTDDGNDIIFSGTGSDHIYGGNGNDVLNGGAGNDVIYGDYKSGFLGGTGGNDTLVGGTGTDDLYGGIGSDKFVFNAGDSAPTYAGSDIIRDFDVINDHIQIVGGPAVTASNYNEVYLGPGSATDLDSFNFAESVADKRLDQYDYVYAFNDKQGYLFADTNGDGVPDLGIELKGLTSFSDFAPSALLH